MATLKCDKTITLFTLAPWPWPSHDRARFCLHWASFTLAKLVNLAKTVSARISARVKCKHTPSPSELFVHMCYMYFKVKFGDGLVRLNVNGIFRQQYMIWRASVNRKAHPAMAKTDEDNFGEGLVRLSVNRVYVKRSQ